MKVFGTNLDNALEESLDRGKRKKPLSKQEIETRRRTVLENWLGEKQKQRFRDPARG